MVSNRFVRLTEKLKRQHIISSRAAAKLESAPRPLTPEELEFFHSVTAPHFGERLFLIDGTEAEAELFVHWYYVPRDEDRLTRCETFHVNMLCAFDVPNRVEMVHIRCASTAPAETEAMHTAIEALSYGKAKIDFQIVPQKANWEHDTIKEAAEYAASTGKYVIYTHFKGTSRIKDGTVRAAMRGALNPLDVLYWSYIMYVGIFGEPLGAYDAVGPIACNRVNKEYLLRDLSWSTQPGYQYIGSFQAFSGKALSDAFRRLGLDRERREKLIWWGGRYTVEMFLCLVFLEPEVHAIAQMENECTAYRMYTKNFCPSMREQFLRLYKGGPCCTQAANSKVAICAVAKDEGPYIKEWVGHYLGLGVSHIYIYDNNDADTADMELVAGPHVTVIPLRGQSALEAMGRQAGVYGDAYRRYGHLYGWMGFFDIDEFVDIDGMDIPTFLSQPLYAGTSVVRLHWRYYGDNGLVHYEDRPVQERFREPAPVDVKYADLRNAENRYVKSFARTGLPEMQADVHSPRYFGAACRDATGHFQYASRTVEDIVLASARVRHYGTKTIEEYIRRRIPNGVDSVNGAAGGATIPAKDRLDWFFNVNDVTEEKLAVIDEMLPHLHYVPPRCPIAEK